MIRVLLGSALPILGIGAVASFLGPDLLTGPRGEPMILAAPGEPSLQAAAYNEGACASTLLLADPRVVAGSGAHIVVVTLPESTDDVAVAVEDYPRVPAAPRTVVLVFDEDGRLIGAGDPNALDSQLDASFDDCEDTPDEDVQSPI